MNLSHFLFEHCLFHTFFVNASLSPVDSMTRSRLKSMALTMPVFCVCKGPDNIYWEHGAGATWKGADTLLFVFAFVSMAVMLIMWTDFRHSPYMVARDEIKVSSAKSFQRKIYLKLVELTGIINHLFSSTLHKRAWLQSSLEYTYN